MEFYVLGILVLYVIYNEISNKELEKRVSILRYDFELFVNDYAKFRQDTGICFEKQVEIDKEIQKNLDNLNKEVNGTIEKQAGLVQDFYGWQLEIKEEFKTMINYYRSNLKLKERELNELLEQIKKRGL